MLRGLSLFPEGFVAPPTRRDQRRLPPPPTVPRTSLLQVFLPALLRADHVQLFDQEGRKSPRTSQLKGSVSSPDLWEFVVSRPITVGHSSRLTLPEVPYFIGCQKYFS